MHSEGIDGVRVGKAGFLLASLLACFGGLPGGAAGAEIDAQGEIGAAAEAAVEATPPEKAGAVKRKVVKVREWAMKEEAKAESKVKATARKLKKARLPSAQAGLSLEEEAGLDGRWVRSEAQAKTSAETEASPQGASMEGGLLFEESLALYKAGFFATEADGMFGASLGAGGASVSGAAAAQGSVQAPARSGSAAASAASSLTGSIGLVR